MKKISVTYFSDAPYTGGAERYLYLLAANLDRDLFSPSIIIKQSDKPPLLASWMQADGIPVVPLNINLTRGLKGSGSLIKSLDELNTDILHLNLPGPFDSQYSLVAPVGRLAGVKAIVSTEHLPMVPSFLKGSLLKSLGTLFIRKVITVSRDNVDHLVNNHRIPERKISFIHNGIPDPGKVPSADIRSMPGIGRKAFLGVMVGSLEKRKGHRAAFRAMSKLPRHFNLLVVGSGEMEHYYKGIVENTGLTGRVHFLGYREDALSIISDSDVMLVPSTLEATPYVIMEAMAVGIPVVANRIYGIPELVEGGKTGLLVEAGKAGELAAALKTLMDQPGLREEMGREARQSYLRHFRMERFISETARLYLGLTGRKR